MKLLAIEDEQKVASFLKEGLNAQGFEVDLAYDSYTGERLFSTNSYDLILLDIIMPGMNGVEFCKKLKQQKPTTPILILSALGTTDDKVTGLEAGADDYLTKPFEFKELVARVRALSKRVFWSDTPSILQVADLQLDLNRKIAIRGEKRINLTSREFSLLEYMVLNKGRVISRIDIAERVWNVAFDTGTNVVEVYINILRKKIDRDFPRKLIQTRVGMGYIIED